MDALTPLAPTVMTVNDFLYILFRHKWKILSCAALGFAAAAAYFFLKPPPFQSEAKLYIRYVLDSSSPGVPGADARSVSTDQRGDTIINTEVEILGSMDIALQVADTVGVDRLMGREKGPKDREHAAALVRQNLLIEPLPKSNVIRLTYQSPDPALVQPVLAAVVDAYLKKHVEVHQGAGAVGDFLSQETDQLRSRLAQTEEELRQAKNKAGIISVDDSKKNYGDQIAAIQKEIFATEAELAERSGAITAAAGHPPTPAPAATGPAAPAGVTPDDSVDEYRVLLNRIAWLENREQVLLTQFTEQNQRVKEVRAQLADAEKRRQALEQSYPGLLRIGAAGPGGAAPAATAAGTFDVAAATAQLDGLQSKIKVLNAELDQIRKQASTEDQMEGTISELQRQKDLQETNYRYYAVHLEANRIDEALGSGRALNIAEIQTPTAPHTERVKERKIIGALAVSGIALGLGWALLIELLFDHSIRRPEDVSRVLRLPLFLSVPDFGRGAHDQHIFHETLRDRMLAYFESRNLTHKPKLLAVTGVGRKSGVTTTASGLAQCLSETGDGNVLLVDMTQSQGSAQQFYKGNPVVGIDQLLDTPDTAAVQDKLFVVGTEAKSDRLSRALPARFSQLVPKLKASDFDYIIFDMPSVNQISVTPRLAGFMDMVLLVVESEHTDRDIARQAAELLGASHAPVGVVLNRSRNYLPSRVHHDFLGVS